MFSINNRMKYFKIYEYFDWTRTGDNVVPTEEMHPR